MNRIKKKIAMLVVLLFLLSFLIYKNITVETSAAGFDEPKIEELTKKIEEKNSTDLLFSTRMSCLSDIQPNFKRDNKKNGYSCLSIGCSEYEEFSIYK